MIKNFVKLLTDLLHKRAKRIFESHYDQHENPLLRSDFGCFALGKVMESVKPAFWSTWEPIRTVVHPILLLNLSNMIQNIVKLLTDRLHKRAKFIFGSHYDQHKMLHFEVIFQAVLLKESEVPDMHFMVEISKSQKMLQSGLCAHRSICKCSNTFRKHCWVIWEHIENFDGSGQIYSYLNVNDSESCGANQNWEVLKKCKSCDYFSMSKLGIE